MSGERSGILVGATWRDKRDWRRKVTITAVEGDRVHVKRNTSRRTQSIAITTLMRNYRFHFFGAVGSAAEMRPTPADVAWERRADRLHELRMGELE